VPSGGVRVLTLLERRPDLTHEEFLDHWEDVHAPLAQQLPGLRTYSQTEVHRAARPPEEPGLIAADGIAELTFASREDRSAAYATLQGRRLLEDGSHFVGRSQSWVVGARRVLRPSS